MRETFPAKDHHPPTTPCFYLIRAADLGKTQIKTEDGTIHVAELMGRVQSYDIGKRLYFKPVDDYPNGGLWYLEGADQKDERHDRERGQGHRC